MSIYTGGSISTGKLIVNGNIQLDSSGTDRASSIQAVEINAGIVSATIINADYLRYQGLDISGNLVVKGSLRVDTSTNLIGQVNMGSNLIVAGNTSTKTLTTPAGFSVDQSGNAIVPGNLSGLSGPLKVPSLSVTALTTPAGLSIDTSANLIVPGTLQVNKPATFLSGVSSAATISARDLSTTAGFSVDTQGNVNVTGNQVLNGTLNVKKQVDVSAPVYANSLNTYSGTSIDVSGNINVPGSGSLNSLYVTNNSAFDNNVYMADNNAISGGEYIGGGLYVNNGITVGDSSNGTGVLMSSNNNVLDVSGNVRVRYGLQVDSSSTLLGPVNFQNQYNLTTNTDLTGDFVSLNTSNNSTVSSSSKMPTYHLPIYINGTKYLILLST
jgi:cytoskeletal protein CcmA (bactofilin family)